MIREKIIKQITELLRDEMTDSESMGQEGLYGSPAVSLQPFHLFEYNAI